MYKLQRRIDQFSTPAEFETLAEFPSEREVTANLVANPRYSGLAPQNVGHSMQVVCPDGDVWDVREWLIAYA